MLFCVTLSDGRKFWCENHCYEEENYCVSHNDPIKRFFREGVRAYPFNGFFSDESNDYVYAHQSDLFGYNGASIDWAVETILFRDHIVSIESYEN